MIEPRTVPGSGSSTGERAPDAEPLNVASPALAPPPAVAPTSAPRSPVRGIVWELIDVDAYAVTCDGDTVGFVDVVGAVYVSLAGPDYLRAVEIAQTLDLESAIAAIIVARG